MKLKKVFKIIGIVVAAIVLLIAIAIGYIWYQYKFTLLPKSGEFSNSSHYIDPEKALLNKDFLVCNEQRILQYYNSERATYSKGKNNLRKFILENYQNKYHSESGYLNIRFIINCKGEAGRYIIHENDLDLNPKEFSESLVDQLFFLTTELKKWNPNYYNEAYYDSYMYISYRIENGEITEIIP